ncbi:hypothetical protein WAC87_004411 [Shigella flexneri]
MMLTKNLKSKFENHFNLCLKNSFSGQKHIKIGNNSITVKTDTVTARIDFTYLNNLRAYGTIIVVKSPKLTLDIDYFKPPYKSNLPNDEYVYCMSTMGEKDGCPLLPTTEDGIDKACDLFINRLNNTYLPTIFNLSEISKELVNDVIRNPKCYSYPFLIVLLAMNKNKLSRENVDSSVILNERMLGFSNDKEIKLRFNAELFNFYYG